MAIKPLPVPAALKVLQTLLPITHPVAPHAVYEVAAAQGWKTTYHLIANAKQDRSWESFLAEFLTHTDKYLAHPCTVIPDHALEKDGTAFTIGANEFPTFIQNSPHFIFDEEFIVVSPQTNTVIAYSNDWPDCYLFIVHP